jgi:hypothetical protein
MCSLSPCTVLLFALRFLINCCLLLCTVGGMALILYFYKQLISNYCNTIYLKTLREAGGVRQVDRVPT